MARFFIDRPIFAWVIAIVIMLAGGLSILQLPIAQYPTIAPPTVTINATYPGASAKVVEDSVTQVIEQKMTGLDDLLYMSSTSESNGSAAITLTFESGTDADIAQVQVQNKLQLATPLLPQIVQQQGIQVSKASPGFLMVIGFVSDDGSLDADRHRRLHRRQPVRPDQPRRRRRQRAGVRRAATRCASGSTRPS